MKNTRTIPALLLAAAAASCAPSIPTTAFTGATVWDGSGADPLADATIVVREGRIVSVSQDPRLPRSAEIVPLDGAWVLPGLVNAHGHVTGGWAPEDVDDPLDRLRGDLAAYARYGVTTVNSLGDELELLAVRDEAPAAPRARVLASGPVVTAMDPAAARAAAEANAEAGVDWLKLRVDDNLGSGRKMPWDAVQAVLDVGRERGLPVATHLFYLDDAKRLLDMGTGMVAHSVRDTGVDDAFVSALVASGVCYVPTLTREISTFVYGERPDFFDDPFFQAHAHPGQVERASSPDFMERMAASPAAAAYRVALEQAMENLATLSEAGARVAMGTDTGPDARFPGYFEHLELWMMVDAGLSPEEALTAATRTAAECAGAHDVGVLEEGRFADFAVYAESPLDDIRATSTLARVFIGGREVR